MVANVVIARNRPGRDGKSVVASTGEGAVVLDIGVADRTVAGIDWEVRVALGDDLRHRFEFGEPGLRPATMSIGGLNDADGGRATIIDAPWT